MSSAAVRSAFREQLANGIASADVSAPYVEVINSPTAPKDRPAEWCALNFQGADEEPVTLGKNDDTRTFRETGVVFAHACAPANKEDTRAVEIADEIRTLFRDAILTGGVVVETVSPPDTLEGKPDGKVFKAIVEMTYRFDITA